MKITYNFEDRSYQLRSADFANFKTKSDSCEE